MTTKKPKKEGLESKKTKFQKFEVKELHRSKLKNAPYNPRTLSDEAAVMIRQNFRTKGLLSPIVWNEQTGNIVSGHQRISQLDALMKTNDYTLDVSVVSLNDIEEREQNLFFNSTTAQGRFDLDALAEMLVDLDPRAAGFDDNDLSIIGYAEAVQTAIEYEGATETVDAMNEMYSAPSPEEAAMAKAEVLKAKERIQKDADAKFAGEPYVTLSFSSYAAKAAFMDRFGYGERDQFIKGELFSSKIERVDE